MTGRRNRILVGMSGGVDSSVAAARLASEGHEVIGVSLQLYDHSRGGKAARCCSPDDFKDARRVAAAFGFPYYVVNQEELFSRKVLDYFVSEYRIGRTPNPCIRCNAEVKFETLAAMSRRLGAGAVATGHYARIETDPATGRRRLLRGLDADKDQSYFLFDLTPEQLALAVFPLGAMSKEAVREEAVRLGLASAGKPESQDVCFVEGGDYRDFLRRHAPEPEAEGEMVDRDGRVVGRHDGLSGFTIGQRRGLGVSSPRRLYVVDLDPKSNRVVLGGEDDLGRRELSLDGVRWIDRDPEDGAIEATVRVRYRHPGAPARVIPDGVARARVLFESPLRGISPGQAAVFYHGDTVIGGGWIRQRATGHREPALAAEGSP